MSFSCGSRALNLFESKTCKGVSFPVCRAAYFFITNKLCHNTNEEVKELDLGLEQSGVRFIRVLSDEDKIDVDVFSTEDEKGPQLLDGFEERMRGMGIVVRE